MTTWSIMVCHEVVYVVPCLHCLNRTFLSPELMDNHMARFHGGVTPRNDDWMNKYRRRGAGRPRGVGVKHKRMSASGIEKNEGIRISGGTR